MLPEPELSFRLVDLRIYSAQLKKILLSTLYYLEIKANGQILYKIGVTTRPIFKRLAEVQRDLQSHFQKVAINVLGTWSSRGNVEKYFKYRYSDSNYPIGSLTEYFKFVDLSAAQAVQRDLYEMKTKVLSSVEQDISDGKPSSIEQAFYAETKPLERSSLNQQHLQEVPESGVDINCSKDSELNRVFLASPSSQGVIEALHQGHSLRHAAEIASVPVNTARKVLAVLQRQ